MGRLHDKVAIITGGARGMGEATARLFVAQGARVLVADVLDKEGEAVAQQLGENCRYRHLDVSSEEAWTKAIAFAEDVFGGIDVLVNNAGVLHVASMEDTTLADFRQVMNINQVGAFLGMKAVIGPMKRRGGGAIVNISSFQALQCSNGLIAYAASKWAIRGMTKTAAVELGRYGIRVNSVHPGGIHTLMGGATGEQPGEQDNAPYSNQPIPRIGKAEEVARVTLFLATDEASYCTGSEFPVDGGWNAGLRVDILPSS